MTRFQIDRCAAIRRPSARGGSEHPSPEEDIPRQRKVYINLEPSLVRSGLVARLETTERYEVTLVQAEADLAFHALSVEVKLQQHVGTACSMVVGKLHALKIAPEGAESSIAEYFFQSFIEEMRH